MYKPKMILFDYGDTLLYERKIDFLEGEKALFPYITHNPRHVTPEQACELGDRLFASGDGCRKQGFEIHEWQMLKLKYEYLGIDFSLSYPELEQILMDHASQGAQMPFVEELLDFINSRGIRSGVISNIGWSGTVLSNRIRRLLPRHQFEFILASSDYCLRKPNRMLFELALRKADLQPGEVWFCGDSVCADLCGANGAHIFPVLYEDRAADNLYPVQNVGQSIGFDHLRIGDWRQMIDLLKRLDQSE